MADDSNENCFRVHTFMQTVVAGNGCNGKALDVVFQFCRQKQQPHNSIKVFIKTPKPWNHSISLCDICIIATTHQMKWLKEFEWWLEEKNKTKMLEWPWASIVVAATCWSVGYPQQIEVPQYAQERQFYTQSRSAPLGTFKIPVSHHFFFALK